MTSSFPENRADCGRNGFGAQKSRVVFSEFCNLGTTNLWVQIILGHGGPPVHSRLSSSLSGFHPLAAY